jgi:hypothetical protein
MGSIVDTLKYEFPVTALQFDSRKVIACTGENGVEVRCLLFSLWRYSSFLGVQPNIGRTYATGCQRTHETGREVAFHGQVSGDGRTRWHGQGMGSLGLDNMYRKMYPYLQRQRAMQIIIQPGNTVQLQDDLYKRLRTFCPRPTFPDPRHRLHTPDTHRFQAHRAFRPP